MDFQRPFLFSTAFPYSASPRAQRLPSTTLFRTRLVTRRALSMWDQQRYSEKKGRKSAIHAAKHTQSHTSLLLKHPIPWLPFYHNPTADKPGNFKRGKLRSLILQSNWEGRRKLRWEIISKSISVCTFTVGKLRVWMEECLIFSWVKHADSLSTHSVHKVSPIALPCGNIRAFSKYIVSLCAN